MTQGPTPEPAVAPAPARDGAAAPGPARGGPSPLADPDHRAALIGDARRMLVAFRATLQPWPGDAAPPQPAGFRWLDLACAPLPDTQQLLHATTRLVHSYALAHLGGLTGAGDVIDRGMQILWRVHRDRRHGGYIWGMDRGQVADGRKLAYGHVFVLLAASTARAAGHPAADRLLADVAQIIDERFWDADADLLRDEFTRDWQPFSSYRGMNANMHGVEGLLAAHEATGERLYLDRARAILRFFLGRMAPAHGWRIPEHYDADWRPDPDYSGDPMFRPAGTTPGHSFEMARLNLQAWDLAGRPDDGAPATSRRLIAQALADAWCAGGGLVYTLRGDGQVDRSDRYWWPVTEAIGALAALHKVDPRPDETEWYRRLWAFADAHLIDHDHGGWYPELGADHRPAQHQFRGKPDIYHALQADLFPLLPGLSHHARDLLRLRPLA